MEEWVGDEELDPPMLMLNNKFNDDYLKIPKQKIKKRIIWYRNKWNLKSY